MVENRLTNNINGRYRTRNGSIVAVHDNIGHLIVDGRAVVDVKISYNLMGDTANANHDLMYAVERGATENRQKVVGCPLCEKES